MGLRKYKVDFCGNEVTLCSEDSRNAIYCVLIRNKIPLNTVKVTKQTKRKGAKPDLRLQAVVTDVETGKVERYRVQLDK